MRFMRAIAQTLRIILKDTDDLNAMVCHDFESTRFEVHKLGKARICHP
jgi:hypothetical protein